MKATVYKIHSDFYYVMPENNGGGLVECKLREVLKKRKIKIKVGDFVEIEKEGAISNLLPRKNTLARPSVSNLDFMAVVISFLEPVLDYTQLNRYLTFLEYHKIPVLLCFNKDDLMKNDDFLDKKAEIISIYRPLGYEIVFTSALSNDGINDFKNLIKGKTIAFCGPSGVGKSSVLCALSGKNIKTGSVSQKSKRGTHTTRHTEIVEFDDIKIIDTPGFSRLTFDFLLPKDLGALFPDIKKFSRGCKFTNCLHTEEDTGCNVVKNLDKIDKYRYKSYLDFLKEAREFKQKTTVQSQKKEDFTKQNQKKDFVKIGSKKRAASRKKMKQETKIYTYAEEKQDD